MARSFTYNGTAYLQTSNFSFPRAFPFSMACWFNAQANPPNNYDFFSVDSKDFVGFSFTFGISTSFANGNTIEAYVADAGANYFRVDVGSSVISQGWIPVVLSCTASGITIYTLQGGNFLSNVNATAITLDGNSYSEAIVGAFKNPPSVGATCNASVAQCALWATALSASDAQAFCKGTLPYKIQRSFLRNWWPVYGLNLPEPDAIAGDDLSVGTPGTTPLFASDPPVQPYIIPVPPMVQGADFQPSLGGANVLQATPAQTLTFVETWNPQDSLSGITFSNGNLTISVPFTGNQIFRNSRGTIPHTSGKFYFEFTLPSQINGDSEGIGVANAIASLGGGNTNWFGSDNNAAVFYVTQSTGELWFGGGEQAVYTGYTITTSTVCQIAIDLNTGRLWFNAGNQGWNGAGSSNDPGAGTGAAIIPVPGALYPGATLYENQSGLGETISAVFESSAFTYKPPNGFSAWGGAKVGLSGNTQSVLYGTNLRGRVG